VSAHTVATYSCFGRIDGEMSVEEVWELLRDIVVHVVIFGPLISRSIEVETCTTSEVIGLVFTLDVASSSTCIWENNRKTILGSFFVNGSFGSTVLISTGKSSKVVKDWRWRSSSGGVLWDEDRESHFALIA